MEINNLRGTGASVSRICLGTMTFGDQLDEAASQRVVDESIDLGVNFIDTADAYTEGQSEIITGKALKGKRDRVFLATKVANPVGPDPIKDAGLNRWHIIHGVEDSLRRLQTDCIDLYYLHRPDRATPIEETMAAMDHLVAQGKINYVGMSNFASWQVCEALWKSDANRWTKPVALQLPYNLITRSIDEECVEFSEKMNLGMVVYNPIAAGMLTGKHTRKAAVEGSRMSDSQMYIERYWHDSMFDAVEALQKIAKEAGLSLVELAYRWLMTQEVVDSIIMGVSKIEQVSANIAAADGRLDEDTMVACDEVWNELRGPHFKYNR
jgi:aryl-alcohol dehydrogenase (NADP+)